MGDEIRNTGEVERSFQHTCVVDSTKCGRQCRARAMSMPWNAGSNPGFKPMPMPPVETTSRYHAIQSYCNIEYCQSQPTGMIDDTAVAFLDGLQVFQSQIILDAVPNSCLVTLKIRKGIDLRFGFK